MQTDFASCHRLLTHLFSSLSFSIFNLRFGRKEEGLCSYRLYVARFADKWSLKANNSDSLTAKHEIGKWTEMSL